MKKKRIESPNTRNTIGGGIVAGAAIALAMGMAACKTNEKPVDFSFLVPEPNTAQFDVELNKRYGIQLAGDFEILQYGSIYLRPESTESFFGFGFKLHTDTFLKESWLDYREVTALPTGYPFPDWMGPVVDVVIPPANTKPLDWHFYFGTRGQYYLGVAGVIKAINEKWPAVNIGYTFYDKQGRAVLGLLFFGPAVDSNGKLVSPGGIFVGTNITPFLPEHMLPGAVLNSEQLRGLNLGELVQAAHNGREVEIHGTSALADIQVTGRDAKKYDTQEKLEKLVRRFGAAGRN